MKKLSAGDIADAFMRRRKQSLKLLKLAMEYERTRPMTGLAIILGPAISKALEGTFRDASLAVGGTD